MGTGLLPTPRESFLLMQNEIDSIVEKEGKKDGLGTPKNEDDSTLFKERNTERRSRNMTQVFPARSGNFVIDIVFENQSESKP